MTLLITLLPFYLLGNLHCIGMCGPLVIMLGKHRYRYFYFLGRTMSFTLASTVAGAIGAIINLALDRYHIPTAASFIFGTIILTTGVFSLLGQQYPGHEWLNRMLAPLNRSISLLLLRDKPWPTFLFGLLTVSLPCGQTLIVFSACAMIGDAYTGFINGLAFSLLTSPSLLLAMNAHKLLWKFKKHYHTITGCFAIVVGLFALCRGLADMELIPHFVVDTGLAQNSHIVFF